MNHGKRMTKLGLAAAIGLGMGNAHAVLQSYTDFAAFKADLLAAGLSYRLHDFNNLTPGTVVNEGNTLDDLTFSSININESGASMMISNLLPGNTRSPDNSLGTNSLPAASGGADNQFENPDNFVMTFPESYAFGLWFQSTTPGRRLHHHAHRADACGRLKPVESQRRFNRHRHICLWLVCGLHRQQFTLLNRGDIVADGF